MQRREENWQKANFFKDKDGQAHFPNTLLESDEIDMVDISKISSFKMKRRVRQ
jgi:hypothetical protein